jgi:alanine dehydrogenase
MSQVAGRLSIQEGAKYLERSFGGRGLLLGGVPGVERGKIAIIGGGIAGTYAAKAAVGMDAQVTLLDINLNRLSYLEDVFGASVTTLYSTDANIRKCLAEADLVIGSVLIPGGATPKLIRREHLKLMKKGAVIVDIAIDQGGCCESSHTTTHDNPVFIEEGVVHYCVGNMPGAVPYTSTIALSNSTFRYGMLMADHGLEAAAAMDAGLANGINIYAHKCTNLNVAKSLGLEYVPARDLMQ